MLITRKTKKQTRVYIRVTRLNILLFLILSTTMTAPLTILYCANNPERALWLSLKLTKGAMMVKKDVSHTIKRTYHAIVPKKAHKVIRRYELDTAATMSSEIIGVRKVSPLAKLVNKLRSIIL